VAICLVVVGSCFAVRDLLFLRSAVKAEGIVVSNREMRFRGNGGEVVKHIPTVKFTDENGVARKLEPDWGVESPIAVGTAISVFYPPSNSKAARVGGRFFWTWSAWLPCVGLVLLPCGGVLVIVSRWLERRWPGVLKTV
jgi:hypothetical protein